MDAIEVASTIANGEDPTAKLSGMAAGEIAKETTEAVLDGKLGDEGAETVGTFVGKIVGDIVEAAGSTEGNHQIDGYSGADDKGQFDEK